MEQDSKAYTDHIEKLLAHYRSSMDAHIAEMENLMLIEAIPIYTRWQELKATIRSFEQLVLKTQTTLRILDTIHNAQNAKEN